MRRLLVLVLLVGSLAGCSDGQITKTEGDVRIWLHESGFATSADAADLQGTMVYDRESRCMFLTRLETRHAVVWPSGTRIEDEDPVMLVSKGETIREEDIVAGGGGYHSFDSYEELIPAECRAGADGVVVFNADSRIEVMNP